MSKKPAKTKKIIVAKRHDHKPIEDGQVVSLLGKLEEKTEKRMANFVKELVKLKKNQIRLQEKLKEKKLSNKKRKKKSKT